jgi:predicted ArsR family transcriptional regulator
VTTVAPEPLGPLPADVELHHAPMSAQRAELLDVLRSRGSGTVSTLAVATGLHQNTVREHLEGLCKAHLVDRDRQAAVGRGRPAWRYVARPVASSRGMGQHLALAHALAGQIARSSSSPAAEGQAAGQAWGQALTAGMPVEPTPQAARRRVVGLLADMGFDPRADPDSRTVLLRRCPLLDTARAHPQVVCAVHRGWTAAALSALGAGEDADQVGLQPFAVPGACVLHLGQASATGFTTDQDDGG